MHLQHTIQNQLASAKPAVLRIGRFANQHGPWRSVLLICTLGLSTTLAGLAAESYSEAISEHLALETRISTRAEQPDPSSENPTVADLKLAVKIEVEALPQGPLAAPPSAKNQYASGTTVVSVMVALLSLSAGGYLIKRRIDASVAASALAEERAKQLLAEDPAVVSFFSELHAVLNPSGAPATATGNLLKGVQPHEEVEHSTKTDPLDAFFAAAPNQLANLREKLSDFSRTPDETGRKTVTLEFLGQVNGFKELARPSELRPVWLMACALEGLLKQLSRDASEVSTSVLRTVASAVDLLEVLSVCRLHPNLATDPPVRLLAVDDDPISRLAISFALKRAFDRPDLAPSGAAALAQAEQQTYDVIFLDIDMPGMDGYELCTRIRQTARNRTTPVVFVTRHGDFNSRAISILRGGESLIAKPFLPFEITVKALTLTLRSRLQNNAAESPSARNEKISGAVIAPPDAPAPSAAIPMQETLTASVSLSVQESQSTITNSSMSDKFSSSASIDVAKSGSP